MTIEKYDGTSTARRPVVSCSPPRRRWFWQNYEWEITVYLPDLIQPCERRRDAAGRLKAHRDYAEAIAEIAWEHNKRVRVAIQ